MWPWADLLQPIMRQAPQRGPGRRPIPAEPMLRLYWMQQWDGLSDPGREDRLYAVASMRRFAGVALDAMLAETPIGLFRPFLPRPRLPEALLERTGQYWSDRGLILCEGPLVDATLWAAPTSPTNREQAPEPQRGSTQKGTTWPLGLKAHGGSDRQGRVPPVVVPSASVQDWQRMDEGLQGDEKGLYGDTAYARAQRQPDAQAEGIQGRVRRKATHGRKLSCADRWFNRKSNRIQARIEHPLGVIKHLGGYSPVRYRGWAKNAAELFPLFAVANGYLTRRELAAT